MDETSGTDMRAALMALSKEQLVEMVALRGNTLLAYIEADAVFRERIEHGTLHDEDLAKLYALKGALVSELGAREVGLIGSTGSQPKH